MDNSEQICAAATRLFARQGFDGTSLQVIADDVGVAKQTLLYHYPSKEALRQRVLANLLEHWRLCLPQMLRAVTGGHRRFDSLTEELVRFFRDDPDRARLLVREVLDNPTGMTQLLADKLRPWLMLIAQYVREGQVSGLVHKAVDPEAYVLNFIVSAICAIAAESVLSGALGHPEKGVAATDRPLSELLRASQHALFVSNANQAHVGRAEEDA